MVTTSDPTAQTHHNLPTPEHAPLTPEEEEELAGLDPEYIAPAVDDESAPAVGDDDAERWVARHPRRRRTPGVPRYSQRRRGSRPPAIRGPLPRRVPPPPLPAALLDVWTLSDRYQRALRHRGTTQSPPFC